MNEGSKKFVVCAREGGANTTPFSGSLAAHFAKQNTKSGGGESEGSEGGAWIPFPPTPFPPRSAPPSSRLWRAGRAIRFSFQKWFEQRLGFATSLDFWKSQGFALGRFAPSLVSKSLSAQLKPAIPPASPRRFVWRGESGSWARSAQSKNTPLKIMTCFCFPIFPKYRCAAQSQFFIPRFTYPPYGGLAKGDK